MAIEELKLPQSVKDVLLENNNSEFYRLLGVDQFGEYISTCLSDMLINTLGSVLVFCSQLYSDPFGDPLAEPVVQTAYYMWLKSDGRRDRRAWQNDFCFCGLQDLFSAFLRRLQWGRCWKRR